ncbi:cytochrome-c peroxidase [Rubrivirga sp.]|uniref:cytochrome-c peroxidase n=1 Tax=Rubrivirga sp. TaxID=1885344 RepID=UPI003C70FA51
MRGHLRLLLAAAFCAAGCDGAGLAETPGPVTVVVPVPDGFEPLPVPPQNPLRADRVALGDRLFFDPILSRDRTVSCGSCHLPELSFSDGRQKSVGVGGAVGLRNAPSLLNVAYRKTLFWDGGALFLESQALVPLEDPHEMDLAPQDALARLREHPEYPTLFAEAFDGDGPNVQTLTYALAAFQRTLVSAPTDFDRYRAGDASALEDDERAGLALFETHCQSCHAGPQLTTDGFKNNGASVTDDDPGRARITFSDEDRGTFRVPSLRAVARTAPYFHDGRFADLEAVVDHYDRGGDGTPGQSARVLPLRLSPDDRAALVAFLHTLYDRPAHVEAAP